MFKSKPTPGPVKLTYRNFISNLLRRSLPGAHAKNDWDASHKGFIGWIKSALSAARWPFRRAGDLKRAQDQEYRQAIIAAALETDEGRVALAMAMVEPIRRSIEYQAVARKLLMIQELPDGAMARYERDVRSTARELADRDDIGMEVQYVN
jgi:hypothetical protein